MNELSPVRKMTFGAALIAIAVVFTLLAKLVAINALPFFRISLTPAVTVFASLALGPIYGALVGVLGDLVPAFLLPTGTMDYNFFLSIVYALLGIFPWAFFQLQKKARSFFSSPWFSLGGMAVLFLGLCLVVSLSDILDSFGEYARWAGLGFVLGTFLLSVLSFCLIWKFSPKPSALGDGRLPSPWETTAMSFLAEAIIMDALKALAFYLFYSMMGGTFGDESYVFFYASLLIGSPINFLVLSLATSAMVKAWSLILSSHS